MSETTYSGFLPPDNKKFTHKRFRAMKSHPFVFSKLLPPNQGEVIVINRQCPALVRLYNIYRGGVGKNLIRYICLVYDMHSPFRQEFRKIEDVKSHVAAMCGFRGESRDIVMDLRDDKMVDAIVDFLRYQNNTLWDRIVVNEEVYFGNQRQLMQKIDPEAEDTKRIRASEYQAKLLAAQDEIAARLSALYSEFTGGDTEAIIPIKRRRAMTPEIVAGYDHGEEYVWPFGEDEEE